MSGIKLNGIFLGGKEAKKAHKQTNRQVTQNSCFCQTSQCFQFASRVFFITLSPPSCLHTRQHLLHKGFGLCFVFLLFENVVARSRQCCEADRTARLSRPPKRLVNLVDGCEHLMQGLWLGGWVDLFTLWEAFLLSKMLVLRLTTIVFLGLWKEWAMEDFEECWENMGANDKHKRERVKSPSTLVNTHKAFSKKIRVMKPIPKYPKRYSTHSHVRPFQARGTVSTSCARMIWQLTASKIVFSGDKKVKRWIQRLLAYSQTWRLGTKRNPPKTWIFCFNPLKVFKGKAKYNTALSKPQQPQPSTTVFHCFVSEVSLFGLKRSLLFSDKFSSCFKISFAQLKGKKPFEQNSLPQERTPSSNRASQIPS